MSCPDTQLSRGRRYPAVPAAAALLVLPALVVLVLTGCRGAGPGRGFGGSGDGAAPATTQQSRTEGPAPASAGTAPGGREPTSDDLTAVDRDLSALSTADAMIGSDLNAAASEAAQPDNG